MKHAAALCLVLLAAPAFAIRQLLQASSDAADWADLTNGLAGTTVTISAGLGTPDVLQLR